MARSPSFRLILILSHLATALAASDFNWKTLKSSTKLNWNPWYDGFQCSSLQFPLDYSSPQQSVASIAMVRLPAIAPKSQYRGPLLFNPGGPGSSGVDTVVGAGAAFATVFKDQLRVFCESDVAWPWTVCSVDAVLFPTASTNATPRRKVGDAQILDAGRKIGDINPSSGLVRLPSI
ncbi:hypothetical protein C8R43DRAFT_1124092 [Mycena crocata]|nr:hypothetical protein C8R43DRAFT_1124092 [Mycena crocata]